MKTEGFIGVAYADEVEPGVYLNRVEEYRCRGDIVRELRSQVPNDTANPPFRVANEYSLILPGSVRRNLNRLVYYRPKGSVAQVVSTARLQDRRVHITLGGEYHGELASV